MTTQVTRVPVGLQEFLGTQAQGKNPSQLAEVIAPTLAIDKFLGVQQEKWSFVQFPNFTANETATIVVPNNEVWLLRTVGFTHKASSANIGATYTASVALRNNPNSDNPLNLHPLGEPYIFTVRAGGGAVHSALPAGEVVAPGGSEIDFVASEVDVTTAIFTSIGFCRYLELKI